MSNQLPLLAVGHELLFGMGRVAECTGKPSLSHPLAKVISERYNAYPELVAALRELHAIDERKLTSSERRVYRIGNSAIQQRVERNRAMLAKLGEGA